jgi:hypothetical protein
MHNIDPKGEGKIKLGRGQTEKKNRRSTFLY